MMPEKKTLIAKILIWFIRFLMFYGTVIVAVAENIDNKADKWPLEYISNCYVDQSVEHTVL